jgi:phosphoribosylformylglycinamidine (FGAM) synthase PurS component
MVKYEGRILLKSWRVFIRSKPKFTDHRGKSLEKEWRQAGLGPVKKVRAGQAYELAGELSRADVDRLAERLLADPVTQEAEVLEGAATRAAGSLRAQVWPKGGVADPVADTVAMAARDLGFRGLSRVRSGSVYEFWGASPKKVESFCEDHLMNKLVQQVEVS